jgi:GT2 family glycosyltransferase
MIDLSIIIINYNTFYLTCKCIESVRQYTSGVNYEIILVDNASTEKDPEEFTSLFPELILIKEKSNVGFAKGNNAGLAVALGKTILLLNSDTEVSDNVIGKLFEKLREMPKVGVITCKLVFPNGEVQHHCGRFPSIILQLIELFRIQKILPKRLRGNLMLGGFFDYSRIIYPDWIWGTFFMIKTEVLSILPNGKFPETYFMYVEDLEWCYAIDKAGYKIYFDPSFKIIHHAGSSSIPFFGKELNPMIKSNFKDFVIRQKGKFMASIFFGLQRINYFLSAL